MSENNANLINHRLTFVDGAFDLTKEDMFCVKLPKHGRVSLCFKGDNGSSSIPIARINLHSADLAVDADAVLEDAYKLGCEIARRWNLNKPTN